MIWHRRKIHPAQLLRAWKLYTLKRYIEITEHCKRLNISLNDVKEHVARAEMRRKRQSVRQVNPVKRCPECGKNMSLFPVNSGPGDQIGGNWQTQWLCRQCENTEFSEKSFPDQVMAFIMRRSRR